MIRVPLCRTLTSLVVLLCAAAAANADVTSTDLQVIGRALSFMQKPLVGTVRTGVVYSPNSPRSVADSRQLQQLLGEGLKVGNRTLVPVLIKTTEVATAQVDLFLLAEGLETDAEAVAAASRSRHIACVTTDIEQVRRGDCTMGVRSAPKVEILVNRAAATAADIQFSVMFRMMITEM